MSSCNRTCRIRKESGSTFYCAGLNKVHSQVSLFQCAPPFDDASEFSSDWLNRIKRIRLKSEPNTNHTPQKAELLTSRKHSMAPTLHFPEPKSEKASITASYSLKGEASSEPQVAVLSHIDPPVHVKRNMTYSSGQSTQQKNVVLDRSSYMDGDRHPLRPLCKTLVKSCPQLEVILGTYPAVDIKALNLDNRNLEPTSCTNRCESQSPIRPSSHTRSASPVRSAFTPDFQLNTLNVDMNVYGRQLNDLIYPLRTPFDSDTRNVHVTLKESSAVNSPETHRNYPEHLNPFSIDAVDESDMPLDVGQKHFALTSENGLASGNATIRIMTGDYRHSVERCDSQSSLAFLRRSTSSSLSHTLSKKIRGSRSKKKLAPCPPVPQINLGCQPSPVYECKATSLQPQQSQCSTLTTQTLRGSSVDTQRFLQSLSKQETQSMIVKRQAPPLPIPNKRVIRGDPSDVRMSVSEIHEKLYAMNKRISELERHARKLQTEVVHASKSKRSVKELIIKLSSVMDQKDSLSKVQSELVKRLRRQELEDRHASLEHEFRLLWAKQDALKTEEEKDREQQLIAELIKTVNERDELVDASEDTSWSATPMEPDKLRKLMYISTLRSRKKKNTEDGKPNEAFGRLLKRMKPRILIKGSANAEV